MTDTEAVRGRARVPSQGPPPKRRGNPEEAMKSAPVKIEAEYRIPIEHHNPMEPHGAIAVWQGDKLTIFDKTQEVYNVREHLASRLGVPEENMPSSRLSSAGPSDRRCGRTTTLADGDGGPRAQAAGQGRLHAQADVQRPRLPSVHDPEGRARRGPVGEALRDDPRGRAQHLPFEEFSDGTTNFTRQVYACPNLYAPVKITGTDLNTPTWMRAPGAVSGMFALECAMDELAYALKIDPLELRLINYAEVDPESGKPWSSKALRECYRLGAEKFGWKDRKPEPRSMRDGRLLVGWGMATGVWGAFQRPANARITLRADGTAHVVSATSDIGPGTYTVMTMIAAEYLGLTPEQVKFELGDTNFPRAPSQGGSQTTSSVGSAVYGAALAVGARLLSLANQDADSPLRARPPPRDVEMLDGRLRLKSDPSRFVSVAEVMKRNGLTEITETFESSPRRSARSTRCWRTARSSSR